MYNVGKNNVRINILIFTILIFISSFLSIA